jgi:hypothetical protein
MLAVYVLFSTNVAAQQQKVKEPEFPTTEDQLVVTQSEEAFHQYEQSVSLEAGLVSRKNDTTSDKDRQIVEMSAKLISGLRKKPEVFDGLGGLLLLSTLDDASRNAALCANEGMIRIAQGLLSKPDVTATYRIMTIAQSCADTSAHLYTQRIGACTLREVD